MKTRRSIAPSAVLWLLLGAAYFFIPLVATLLFSLKSNTTGKCCTAANYSWVIHNGDFWHSLKISFLLALETIVISLAIFVPTIYWVHLKLPKLRPVIAFLALIPFVVPPIVMVVGLLHVFKGTPHWFYAEPWGFPLEDIQVLQDPERIEVIMKDGKIVDTATPLPEPTRYNWEYPLLIWSDPRLPDQDYVRRHASIKPRWMQQAFKTAAE